MSSSASFRAVGSLAAIVVVAFGLRLLGSVVVPIITAVFIAVMSLPVLSLLERTKMPSWLAAILTLVLDAGILAGIVALGASSVSGLEDALPHYASTFRGRVTDVEHWLRSLGMPRGAAELDHLVAVDDVPGMARALLGELTAVASNALLVVLLVAFVLFEARAFERKLTLLLGSNENLERVGDAARRIQRYLVVKTGISALVAVLVFVVLYAAGVDFPLFWALMTFLFNYVPTIGPAFATAPPTLLAFVEYGPTAGFAALGGQLVVHVVVGNVVEPRVMGEALGISTFVVMVSMLFWGWLWGPMGALFAVPLTALLISVLETSEETRWLALLLASNERAEANGRAWGWTEAAKKRSLPPPTPTPPAEPRAEPRDAAE